MEGWHIDRTISLSQIFYVIAIGAGALLAYSEGYNSLTSRIDLIESRETAKSAQIEDLVETQKEILDIVTRLDEREKIRGKDRE